MLAKKLSLLLLLGFTLAAKTPTGLDNALDISTSGVRAQGKRMEVIAENIANVDTIKTAEGLPYRKKTVVLAPVEYLMGGFASAGKFNILEGVRVARIVSDKSNNFKKIYEPGSPEADEHGYVYYPNVDITKELVDMNDASNAFEANITAFNATKAMMQSSLEIGR